MAAKSGFKGFPKEAVKFFTDLADNNNKTWFAEHKEKFETNVLAPARDFVYEMGKQLQKIAPNVVADPRVDKSIFRIYRDTRFSKDKSPYKNHLGIFFWEGHLPKMECSGFYFHLEPPTMMLAVGNHCFSKRLLPHYRESVVHKDLGPALAKAARQVSKKRDYSVGGQHYKKTPRGFDPNHDNAEFLLHDGLWAAVETAIPDELYSDAILKYCFTRFKDMAPLHYWLLEMTKRFDK